jgi:hypothetical protein
VSRAPLDTSGGREPTAEEFEIAVQVIHKSGVVERLESHLIHDVGLPRQLSLRALMVAFQLNALQRHHRAHLVQAARVLNAMSEEQRGRLGITRWDSDETYPRVERLFVEVCRVLDQGDAGVDATWFANRLARAAIPKSMLTSHSIAVDGTDVETWGRLQGTTVRVDLDGEAAETQLVEETSAVSLTKKGKMRRARVIAIGPDGRKQYTADPDARAGHRSAKGNRNAGTFVGYECHLAVQTRDVKWTNHSDRTTLGPEVPAVITTCTLVAAGSHRGRAIVDDLIRSKEEVSDFDNVVWDPGYSLCQPGTTAYPLAQAGIEQTLELVTHQRGIRPFAGEALLLDGQLYSSLIPRELRDLAMPPRGAPKALRRKYERAFNQRARWRYVRHSKPDKDGVTRWKCPFCAGLLRSRRFPETMRRSRIAPLVEVPDGVTQCCDGTLSAPPAELPLAQRIPFGTTAWRVSMYRRQAVESVNAALKGSFADVSRGFFRVFGLVKITVLLGFTLAAYNLDRVRSFRAKRAETDSQPKIRAKRRLGTWEHCITPDPEATQDDTEGPPG